MPLGGSAGQNCQPLRLARELAAQDRLAEAVSHCQRAVEQDPTDASAYSLLGSLYEQMGQPDRALGAYRKSVRLRRKPARQAAAARSLAMEMALGGAILVVGLLVTATAMTGMRPPSAPPWQSAARQTAGAPSPDRRMPALPAVQSAQEPPLVTPSVIPALPKPSIQVVRVSPVAPRPAAPAPQTQLAPPSQPAYSPAPADDQPPPPPPATLDSARSLYLKGQAVDAAEAYQQILDQSPGNVPRLHQELALAYQQAGRAGLARRHYLRAIEQYRLELSPESDGAVVACRAGLRALGESEPDSRSDRSWSPAAGPAYRKGASLADQEFAALTNRLQGTARSSYPVVPAPDIEQRSQALLTHLSQTVPPPGMGHSHRLRVLACSLLAQASAVQAASPDELTHLNLLLSAALRAMAQAGAFGKG